MARGGGGFTDGDRKKLDAVFSKVNTMSNSIGTF